MRKSELVGLTLIVILLLLMSAPRIMPYFPLAFSISFGGSMFPNIQSGDGILMLSTRFTNLHVGDIAVYKSTDSKFIIHRVVGIRSGEVIFWGDNNPREDLPVPRGNVYYKVVYVIPSIVWSSILSLLFTLYGVYLVRTSGGGIGVPIGSLVYFVLVAMFIITLSVQASMSPLSYSVKPNPMVVYTSVTYSKTGVYLHINHPDIVSSVSCFLDQVVVPCDFEGNTITIHVNGTKVLGTSKPILVNLKLKTPYNVTETITLNKEEVRWYK